MARKERHTKTSHAAHVKRHTVGTSNELSFSVLDAAKNAADGDKGKGVKGKGPRFGGIPLFTLPGRKKPLGTPLKDEALALSEAAAASVSATASGATRTQTPSSAQPTFERYVAPVDEIARRKSRRRIRRRLAFTTMLVLLMAIGVMGISLLYKESVVRGERVSLVDTAIEDLSRADLILVEMDTLINSGNNEEIVTQAADLQARLPQVVTLLDQAESTINQADSGMTSASDKEVIVQAKAAVSARRDLVAQGSVLLDASVTAKEAADTMISAWETVLGGDKLARDAAAVIADTTEQNVVQSQELSVQAKDLFETALADIAALEGTFGALDISPQLAYIAKRAEAMGYALASDEAILSFDKALASEANDAYNTADAEATLLAESLPEDPAQPVYDGFNRTTESANKRYGEARSIAATADAFLRDYLGTQGK